MRVLVWVAVLGAGLVAASVAQTPIAKSNDRFHEISQYGRVEPPSFVRDANGVLYFVYIQRFNPPQFDVAIARSTDGGQSWNLKWQTGFAANPTGDFGNYEPTLAVDGNGNLHCAWTHRPQQNSNGQTVRYNRFDAATQKWGAEVTTGITPSRYNRNAALAVDSKDHVYFVHAHASTGRATLFKSDKPYASDLKFTAVTPAFAASGSVYEASMVIDAVDRVHVAYYCSNGYTVPHQCFDGVATATEAAHSPAGPGQSRRASDRNPTSMAKTERNQPSKKRFSREAKRASQARVRKKKDGEVVQGLSAASPNPKPD